MALRDPGLRKGMRWVLGLNLAAYLIAMMVFGEKRLIPGAIVAGVGGALCGWVAYRVGHWKIRPSNLDLASAVGRERIWSFANSMLAALVRRMIFLLVCVFIAKSAPDAFSIGFFLLLAVVDFTQEVVETIFVAVREKGGELKREDLGAKR